MQFWKSGRLSSPDAASPSPNFCRSEVNTCGNGDEYGEGKVLCNNIELPCDMRVYHVTQEESVQHTLMLSYHAGVQACHPSGKPDTLQRLHGPRIQEVGFWAQGTQIIATALGIR